jgi:hypothetical protein
MNEFQHAGLTSHVDLIESISLVGALAVSAGPGGLEIIAEPGQVQFFHQVTLDRSDLNWIAILKIS